VQAGLGDAGAVKSEEYLVPVHRDIDEPGLERSFEVFEERAEA
jgi:hypothetical protein